MPLIFKERESDLIEWMDRRDCDQEKLFNTYRQFYTINKLLSGWSRLFDLYLKPIIEANGGSATILDIGCGGGDILNHLDKLCQKAGYNVQLTGADPDPRAKEFFEMNLNNREIRFRQKTSSQLVEEGARFDIVISNHLLHHLTNIEVNSLCRDSEKLAKQLVLFNDIERSDIGYGLFAVTTPIIFRNSFISVDGKISIRRSFRKDELQDLLPDGWDVKRKFPFRLLAMHQKRTG
ncbi:methyltransferase domain-containing protein [Rhodohalobacter sp.]|uniref:methyltransferase domain-containing protein n=1 Tax=Rhodohalobacter sp. TaxID=1974210 RepID=UPI002ACF0225|nr:methyltransferase domain-containing protein [Rhodohalobacter sp.]MDZ7755378.1 methyltransferase domain-containing protein [Rhodohalobacter sp.]